MLLEAISAFPEGETHIIRHTKESPLMRMTWEWWVTRAEQEEAPAPEAAGRHAKIVPLRKR